MVQKKSKNLISFLLFCRNVCKTSEEHGLLKTEPQSLHFERIEGYSYREVAGKLGHGVTPSGIRKMFKCFQETGSVENKTARGRNRLITPNTDRRITRLALNNRRAS